MTLYEALAVYDLNVIKKERQSEKTYKNYRTAVNSFINSLGDLPVELIGEEHIAIWQLAMEERGNQPSHINTNFSKLRCLLKYAKKRGARVMDGDDITRVKEDSDKPRVWLKWDEAKAMIDACSNLRDQALIACLWDSGCRISELLSIDRPQLKDALYLEQHKIWIKGKGSKYRKIRFDKVAEKYLLPYLDSRNDQLPPLFISGQFNRLGVSRAEQIVTAVAVNAGLDKHVTPHILRHSFASDLLSNKAPMGAVQHMMGHKNITTTMNIYGHFLDKEIDEVYAGYHTNQ